MKYINNLPKSKRENRNKLISRRAEMTHKDNLDYVLLENQEEFNQIESDPTQFETVNFMNKSLRVNLNNDLKINQKRPKKTKSCIKKLILFFV